MNKIAYGKQYIDDEDIQAVAKTLQSDYLTQGPKVKEFETEFSKICQSKHAFTFTNATAALHTACLSLDLTANDYVWTSPITFVASANCARMCNAKVDFVDIDEESFNLSPQALSDKLKNTPVGKIPKIIIPVHFSGRSCEMKEIKKIADNYKCKIIEDASHAIGASYEGQPVGSCQYSDACVFSLHPVKIITTGEGGFITTNNDKLIQKAKRIASHGIVKDNKNNEYLENEPWRYKQIELGYNYRLTDIQSALGISQLKKLKGFIQRRLEIVDTYNKALKEFPITLPLPTKSSSWHLYVIQLANPQLRLELYRFLRTKNIFSQIHYVPVHMQPYYQELGFNLGDFPIAEKYYEGCISLPIYPKLSIENQKRVIDEINLFFSDHA